MGAVVRARSVVSLYVEGKETVEKIEVLMLLGICSHMCAIERSA